MPLAAGDYLVMSSFGIFEPKRFSQTRVQSLGGLPSWHPADEPTRVIIADEG